MDLLAVVWLVEAEEVSGRILVDVRSGLHVGSPLAGDIRVVRVKHRDELKPGVEVTARAGVPVVGPGSSQHLNLVG